MPVEYTIAQEAVKHLESVGEMPHFGDNNYARVVAWNWNLYYPILPLESYILDLNVVFEY